MTMALARRDEDNNNTLYHRAISTGLAPVQVLTSRPAIKAYLSTILFLTASFILISISTTAYAFFYYRYIPQINLERVIHLQYGGIPGQNHPHATIPLETTALISQQAYDINMVIHMPRTPSNLEAGNFMLDLVLLAPGTDPASNLIEKLDINIPQAISAMIPNISSITRTVHRSRRPAILPYCSRLVSLSHKVLHLPWHLLGLRDLDSSTLVVPMFEYLTFPRGAKNVPTHIKLEVQSLRPLQIYTTKIVFRARFGGLRYLIYNHRIASFLVFTALFYGVSITTMGLAWGAISMLFSSASSNNSALVHIKKEDEGSGTTKKIKSEPTDDLSSGSQTGVSALSDTPTTFPVWSRTQPGLAMTPKPLVVGDNPQGLGVSEGHIKSEEGADDEDDEPAALQQPRIKNEDDDDEKEEDEEAADEASYLALQRERERLRRKKEREEIGDSGIGTGIESESLTAGGIADGRGLGSGTGRDGRNASSTNPGPGSGLGLTRRRSGRKS